MRRRRRRRRPRRRRRGEALTWWTTAASLANADSRPPPPPPPPASRRASATSAANSLLSYALLSSCSHAEAHAPLTFDSCSGVHFIRPNSARCTPRRSSNGSRRRESAVSHQMPLSRVTPPHRGSTSHASFARRSELRRRAQRDTSSSPPSRSVSSTPTCARQHICGGGGGGGGGDGGVCRRKYCVRSSRSWSRTTAVAKARTTKQ